MLVTIKEKMAVDMIKHAKGTNGEQGMRLFRSNKMQTMRKCHYCGTNHKPINVHPAAECVPAAEKATNFKKYAGTQPKIQNKIGRKENQSN